MKIFNKQNKKKEKKTLNGEWKMVIQDYIQTNMFVAEHYDFGDIEEFISELNYLEVETTTDSDKIKNQQAIGTIIIKFMILYHVFHTKKILKEESDMKAIGKYVQKLGKEIESLGSK